MYVNKGEKGITQDWNFAYQCADSRYVTIAHQDDVYLPDYWEKVYNHIKRAKKPLIAFGDYGELRKDVYKRQVLSVYILVSSHST